MNMNSAGFDEFISEVPAQRKGSKYKHRQKAHFLQVSRARRFFLVRRDQRRPGGLIDSISPSWSNPGNKAVAMEQWKQVRPFKGDTASYTFT